jgi:hypothetical protein
LKYKHETGESGWEGVMEIGQCYYEISGGGISTALGCEKWMEAVVPTVRKYCSCIKLHIYAILSRIPSS